MVSESRKGISLRRTAFWHIFCQSRCGVLSGSQTLGVRGRSRKSSRENKIMREIAHAQKPNPLSNLYKIWHDHRLRDFWVAGGTSYRSTSAADARAQHQTRRRPAQLPSIDGTDRRTDGRTPDRYVDPAPHTMRAA